MKCMDFATVLKTADGHCRTRHRPEPCFVHSGCLDGRARSDPQPRPPYRERKPAGSRGHRPCSISSINFSWSDKIEPRLGAAWGSRDGKLKIFGSYGVTNDVMKLLLAQTSWGAQGFETCTYPLGPDASGGFSNSDVTLAFNAGGRACPTGVSNVGSGLALEEPLKRSGPMIADGRLSGVPALK